MKQGSLSSPSSVACWLQSGSVEGGQEEAARGGDEEEGSDREAFAQLLGSLRILARLNLSSSLQTLGSQPNSPSSLLGSRCFEGELMAERLSSLSVYLTSGGDAAFLPAWQEDMHWLLLIGGSLHTANLSYLG